MTSVLCRLVEIQAIDSSQALREVRGNGGWQLKGAREKGYIWDEGCHSLHTTTTEALRFFSRFHQKISPSVLKFERDMWEIHNKHFACFSMPMFDRFFATCPNGRSPALLY